MNITFLSGAVLVNTKLLSTSFFTSTSPILKESEFMVVTVKLLVSNSSIIALLIFVVVLIISSSELTVVGSITNWLSTLLLKVEVPILIFLLSNSFINPVAFSPLINTGSKESTFNLDLKCTLVSVTKGSAVTNKSPLACSSKV